MIYKTVSSRETKKLAASLAKEILTARLKNSRAVIIALSGDLGAGKTTFVQGFMKGAGIKRKITSPTFIIIKNYELRIKNYGDYKRIYHIDCYRIHRPKELLNLGIKEIFNSSQNIVLIEWPERLKNYLPKNVIRIKFQYGEKENERIIKTDFLRRSGNGNRCQLSAGKWKRENSY